MPVQLTEEWIRKVGHNAVEFDLPVKNEVRTF